MLSSDARVICDGKEIMIPAKDLIPGDICLLGLGEKVPSDLWLVVLVTNLATGEAALTGEAAPINKEINAISHTTRDMTYIINCLCGNTMYRTTNSGNSCPKLLLAGKLLAKSHMAFPPSHNQISISPPLHGCQPIHIAAAVKS
jgi:P-type E1-E2 ATPase